jgi:hypothetical protein
MRTEKETLALEQYRRLETGEISRAGFFALKRRATVLDTHCSYKPHE